MTAPTLEPISLETLRGRVGEDVGVSDWIVIDQRMIDAFADVSGDHQYIHVDPGSNPGRNAIPDDDCAWLPRSEFAIAHAGRGRSLAYWSADGDQLWL